MPPRFEDRTFCKALQNKNNASYNRFQMYSLKVTLAESTPLAQQKHWCNDIVDPEISTFSTSLNVAFVAEPSKGLSDIKQHDRQNEDVSRNGFRPRLVSESSVDSEDSYCIIFQTGSDYEDDSESESNSECECKNKCWNEENDISFEEDDDNDSSTKKVKFNLKPTVHQMIKWNYAYRAARKGPWEEMARDRERFKGRINSIGRVLNPILNKQHRSHIWQERFKDQE